MILVQAQGLEASRPGRVLFEDLDLTISDGDRLAVVGINGTGKSTLLGVLAERIEPERGEVRRGREVEVAMLDQAPRLHGDTLGEALRHELGAGAWEVEAVADRLGLGGEFGAEVGKLSGGQLKRAALARALVSGARLLVLDEPTNHLDVDAIDWLEDRLASHTGGLVMVTHDRHFLDRVCTRILELDHGRAHVHEGGYAAYLEHRAERARAAEVDQARRANLARRELEWLRRGAPARTSKPKARVASATELVNQRVERDIRADELPLHRSVPRLGDRVVELHGVGHGFDGAGPVSERSGSGASGSGDPDETANPARMLFEDVELLLDPRERLGIVGPNGSGKSTLLDIIAGRLEPTEGTVEFGSTVRVGVYDQQGSDLDDSLRVWEVVAGPGSEPDWTHKSLMEAFWFDSDAQWAPVGTLSGGERRRLQLLVTLAASPNVLLLDEPTNDLDTETLRALEDFLEGFPGAVVVVSHDRAFLERVVTDVVVLGDGSAKRTPGGYAAYEAQRRALRAAGKAHARRPPGRSGASGRTPDGTSGRAAPEPGGPERGVDRGPSPSTLRHRLRAAQREVEKHRTRRDELAAALEGTREHGDLAELGESLARAEADLGEAEEEWLGIADEMERRGLKLQ
ncbi:MAG: ATP-binding cassette domain-containing protein [Microthrixaceae bacterium]|nr:ATP-binding cassette domain-containing protein [Microthrixaceae bacterium]